MKKNIIFLLFFFILATFSASFQSCGSTKSGCPAENAQVRMGKDGKLPTGGGRSNLFPKGMRKKMGGK